MKKMRDGMKDYKKREECERQKKELFKIIEKGLKLDDLMGCSITVGAGELCIAL